MVKETPYAHEIEMGILACCILDHHQLAEIQDIITPDVFYNEKHELIYQVIVENSPVDLVILENRLKEKGKLDYVGGVGFLSDLLNFGTGRYEEYCQILLEKKILRDVIDSCQGILKKAWDGADPYSLLDDFSQRSSEIGVHSGVKHSLTPSEIRERDKNTPKAEKLFLGFSQLDYGMYADGMRKGQVEVTMADSGHGKTAYALFKAESLLRKGYKVAWFQLEGYDSETSDYIFSTEIVNHDNIFICDKLNDIEDIKREARKINREHDIDFAVFDYVQNIDCNQNISKTEKVEYISKHITRLAKDLNIVCNPLSQVTIDSSRTGWQQEPRYNDVRWSKQLKQDASVITSVFRPSRIDGLVINENLVKNWNDESVPYNSVYVKQAKVRHGAQEWKRLHMIHTDKGLKPYEANQTQPPHVPMIDDEQPF